jgi:hypothetical protein
MRLFAQLVRQSVIMIDRQFFFLIKLGDGPDGFSSSPEVDDAGAIF